MKRLLLLLLSVLCCCYIYAQRTAVVTATATYEAPLNMSPIEAEYEAVRHAQINAIAREFGTIVTSESHNYMRENSNTSSDDFFSYGEMDVRGEWLETIGDTIWQPARREGGMVVYDVKLKGRIREIVSTPPDVHYTFMYNGTDPKLNRMRNSTFYDGDQLYFNFSSPVDGYLALYLVDHNNSMTTQRLLPYPVQSDGAYFIKADTTYTFFSEPDAEPFVKDSMIELLLGCESDHDFNQFYIIFSPNQFTRANDHKTAEVDCRQLPPSTDYASFQKWLSRNRRRDKDMFVEKIVVAVVKP